MPTVIETSGAVNRIFSTAIFLVALLVRVNAHSQDAIVEVSKEKSQKAEELFFDYLHNRDKFERYACCIQVELTSEDFVNSENSTYRNDWFFRCEDHTKKLVRQDQILMQEALNKGEPVSIEVFYSMFLTDKKVKQFIGKRSRQLLVEDAKDEDWDSLKKQCYFDPWEVPFVGWSCFRNKRLTFPRNRPPIESMFERMRVTEFDEIGDLIGVERVESAKHQIFDRIRFSKRQGDMPISLERVNKDPNYLGVMEAITTKWKKAGNGWIPSETLIKMNIGLPSKPSAKRTYRVKYFWTLGRQLEELEQGVAPRSLFSDESVIPPYVLRDRFRRFASSN